MSFSLTKTETETFDKLTEDLAQKSKLIEEAVSVYNIAVQPLRIPVEEAVTEYNQILLEVRELRNTIVTKAQDNFSGKSEKWQESDSGQAAEEWINSWEEIDLDDIDYQWPDELTIDLPDHANDLETMATEAEQS